MSALHAEAVAALEAARARGRIRSFYIENPGDSLGPRYRVEIDPDYSPRTYFRGDLRELIALLADPNPRETCDTCGRWTGFDTHICGTCAEDWNDRDVAAGTRRINARRKKNGLEPIERDQ